MKPLSDAAILDTVREEQCNSRYGSPYRAIARKAESEMLKQVGEWGEERCLHRTSHLYGMSEPFLMKRTCSECWQELKEANAKLEK